MKDFSAAAEWNDQPLERCTCEWSDGRGNFGRRAELESRNEQANFQARSSLDLKGFLDAFRAGRIARRQRVSLAALVEISGSLGFEPNRFRPDVIGHAAFGQFSLQGESRSPIWRRFSWDGARTFRSRPACAHKTGQLRADLLDAPADFRLNVESTISPDALRVLVPREPNDFLRDWDGKRSPVIRLAIRARIAIRRIGKAMEPSFWGEPIPRTWMNGGNTQNSFRRWRN